MPPLNHVPIPMRWGRWFRAVGRALKHGGTIREHYNTITTESLLKAMFVYCDEKKTFSHVVLIPLREAPTGLDQPADLAWERGQPIRCPACGAISTDPAANITHVECIEERRSILAINEGQISLSPDTRIVPETWWLPRWECHSVDPKTGRECGHCWPLTLEQMDLRDYDGA